MHRWIIHTVAAVAMAVGPMPVPAADAAEPTVRWKLASPVPSTVPIIGATPKRFTEQVKALTGGEFEIDFHEPGALVPPLEIFDAVAKGSVDAGWGPPGLWAGKIRVAPLFSAVPFGPGADEYLAWMRHGGGLEIWQEIAARHAIHPIICSVEPPEASGWFREPVTSLDDLKGLKMRFFGFGARVMQKLGVSTQLLAPADIFPALERGVIDAAELSMPAVDLGLGFHRIAKHYYFPGWHQPATLVHLLINQGRWQELPKFRQAQLEAACGYSIVRNLAEGEASQVAALKEIEANGVQLHRWPEEMLDAFEAAWDEVVAELRTEDEDFERTWASLQAFRSDYQRWKELGHLE
jgi:TRAP-type mannitol/chloroaromatic compound transport system substrate-binding protein